MPTAIELGREKYRAKVSEMTRKWTSFAERATGASFSAGLQAAGIPSVNQAVVSSWVTGLKAGIAKYAAKITSGAADKWYSRYMAAMSA